MCPVIKFPYRLFVGILLLFFEMVLTSFILLIETLVDPISPKIKDLSNVPNCGVSTDYERATEGKLCDLTPQPCYYTLVVNKVFKGKKKVTYSVINIMC